MKIYKIYKLTCLITNMSYIGRTCKNVFKRISQHIAKNSPIGEALREHEPKNFKLEILWVTTNKKTASRIESVAISFYNSKIPNGYNQTKSGSGGDTFSGKKHTEKTLEKMRGKKKPGTGEATKKSNIGNKYGEANKGKKFPGRGKGTKKLGTSKALKGNQYGKGKNLGKNNPCHRVDVKIKCLKTRLAKLEKGELK